MGSEGMLSAQCEDMCSEYEKLERITQGEVESFERVWLFLTAYVKVRVG